MSSHARKHWREPAPAANAAPRPELVMPSGRAGEVVKLKKLREDVLPVVWRGLYIVDRPTYDNLRGLYRVADPLLAGLTEAFDASPTIPLDLYNRALAAGKRCEPKN